MVNLDMDDRLQLITLLKDIPELQTERSRLQILESAGLRQLVPMMDLSGATYLAANEIVTYLSKYGRLTHECSALGLFLNTIKSFVGVQQQELLDRLLTKYNLITSIAVLPDIPNISQWKGTETTEDVLEKIIGENTLRPIAFLERGLEVARSVAYIRAQCSWKSWPGTGFLVTKDLLLTNNHVLPSSNFLPYSIFRFNYQDDFWGRSQPSEEYHAKSGGLFHTNKELDYTLVQLDQEPGQKWGYLPLLSKNIEIGERVNIIQHPEGRAKEISFQNNFVEFVGGNVVQYITSTLQGSSGSPVLNDGWEVVALHHAGRNITDSTTQQIYIRNEGILVERILANLPLEISELLNLAAN